jgi:hypothetical protein
VEESTHALVEAVGVDVLEVFYGRRGGGDALFRKAGWGHGGYGHVCGFCQNLGWLEMQSMD